MQKLTDHCLDTLGYLVANGQNAYANEIKNRIYLEDLKKAQIPFIEEVLSWMSVNRTAISEENWISSLVSYDKGSLLEPKGWRFQMNKSLEEKPKKINLEDGK